MAATTAAHQSSREVRAASSDHRLSALRAKSAGLDLEKGDSYLDDFERPFEARGTHVVHSGPIGSAGPYSGCLYNSQLSISAYFSCGRDIYTGPYGPTHADCGRS